MTEDQIEAAARKLCELRGIDPDTQLERPVAMSLAAYQRTDPREWKIAADEIRAFDQVRQAVHFVETAPGHFVRAGDDGRDTRRAAPWRDFAGAVIHDGDTIQHPTGDTATVVYDESREEMLRWRAVYSNGESLWLGNQIGDKGRAIVVPKG